MYKFFFPLFTNEQEEVSERCPFKKSRDLYREIESRKTRRYNKRKKEEEWKDVDGKVGVSSSSFFS
jgi:hypothetical protein|tara:strand:+ start:654 stop:851 length:198 start_codon:yes stop_codon:yes gene_type:complete